ncbi:MAG: FAD-binding oxidoreductase [Pseudomonadales bacterium]|jgi:glycine oxidase|nr:FAD-binding oxidoreductase [Pseudomonadales bacterium]
MNDMRIGIAGAGLAGRLLAWRLLRTGYAVTLFDRDDGSGQESAAYAAAAMLAPYSETVGSGHALIEPGLRAIEIWRAWLAELEQDSGLSVPWQQRGSVVVAHPLDRGELTWFQQKLQTLTPESAADCQFLNAAALYEVEPELSAFSEALYLPREGCIDNRALFAALTRALTQRGADWHSGQTILEVSAGRILTTSGSHAFTLALDCRGTGAKAQMPGLRGVRGELLWLHAPEVKLNRPVRLMHPRYQLYIAPRPEQVYVIGATELESESMAPITVRSELELLSALYSVHEGFSEASVLEARSHCRPAFADNLPKISLSEGLMRVNGLYRHGYLLGPLLVESALAALHGQGPLPPIKCEGALFAREELH